MTTHPPDSPSRETPSLPPETDEERRNFLAACGKFAAITPPTVAMMLSTTSLPAHAAASTFPGVGWGVGSNPETKKPGKRPYKRLKKRLKKRGKL
jgi:hypothetical protein